MEIKIYLVEKQQMIRQGFKALLQEDTSFNVRAEATDLNDVNRLALLATDVLMVECARPFGVFLQNIRNIKANHPDLKILVFTADDDDLQMLREMLEIGICGYLTVNATKEELFHSLRKIMDDGIYVCTAFVLRMLKNPSYIKVERTGSPIALKSTEQTVLRLIADGLTNNEIALQLFVSVRTIETRRKKILEKTGTTNTATLIRYAVQHGLIG